MRILTLLPAALAATILVSAAPARADWDHDDWRAREWREQQYRERVYREQLEQQYRRNYGYAPPAYYSAPTRPAVIVPPFGMGVR